MFDRSATRPRNRLGHGTLIILFATLLAALSMFFASAVDVSAMLPPVAAAASGPSTAAIPPVEIPAEWVWRGRKPVSLEYMYGNHEPPQQDWIRMGRSQ